MTDPVLTLATELAPVDNEPLVQFGLKFTGVLATTPMDRVARAVAEEIADLVRRARAAIEACLPADPSTDRAQAAVAHDALALLRGEDAFPREALDALVARVRATAAASPLTGEIERWTERHRALERRVRWLLHGTPRRRRAELDPLADADELHHVVTHAFRFEARVLELLAINRIAQSATIGTFFRSTREAETNAVARFFDTYALYANVFEWGVDSYRGRAAIERMNQIHGRYYIPNAEMKFVLLQGAFTWLDGADRIGHRTVTAAERQGMLASWVRLGRAMHIQDLTEDYGESYGWYREVCLSTADRKPYKRATFESIVGASLAGPMQSLREALFLAAQVAMDETYRSAVGYPDPTKEQVQGVRAAFFTVGSLIEQLPYAPYLRSLVNTPLRRAWTDPKELGVSDRSAHMPAAFAGLPNGGFPEWQAPIRSTEAAAPMEYPAIAWEEVQRQAAAGKIWVVVHGFVHDLTMMHEVHPGGATILKRWAGKDATRAFEAARHSQGTQVFSLNYRIGRVVGAPVGPVEPGDEGAVREEVATTRSAHRRSGAVMLPLEATLPTAPDRDRVPTVE